MHVKYDTTEPNNIIEYRSDDLTKLGEIAGKYCCYHLVDADALPKDFATSWAIKPRDCFWENAVRVTVYEKKA